MARVVLSFYSGAVAIEPGGKMNRALGDRPEAIVNATDQYAADTEDEDTTEDFAALGGQFSAELGVAILTAIGNDVQVYIGKSAPKGNRYDVVLDGAQRAFGIRRGQTVYVRDDA